MQTARTRFRTRRYHGPVIRSAILAVALVQVLAGFALHPVSSGSFRSALPHFHAAGDPLDLGHDETACPVFTVHQTAFTHAQPVRLPISAVRPFRFARVPQQPFTDSHHFHRYSRAPPLG